jgi:hypothetical protein
MYKIILNGKEQNNPKYSVNCTSFEKYEIQKLKSRYPGALVQDKNGDLKPIENF